MKKIYFECSKIDSESNKICQEIQNIWMFLKSKSYFIFLTFNEKISKFKNCGNKDNEDF